MRCGYHIVLVVPRLNQHPWAQSNKPLSKTLALTLNSIVGNISQKIINNHYANHLIFQSNPIVRSLCIVQCTRSNTLKFANLNMYIYFKSLEIMHASIGEVSFFVWKQWHLLSFPWEVSFGRCHLEGVIWKVSFYPPLSFLLVLGKEWWETNLPIKNPSFCDVNAP
jgi:hypothetical protein